MLLVATMGSRRERDRSVLANVSDRLQRFRGAQRTRSRRLLPLRRAARLLRLPRIGDDGDAANARDSCAPGLGVRARSVDAGRRYVQAHAAASVRVAGGVLP